MVPSKIDISIGYFISTVSTKYPENIMTKWMMTTLKRKGHFQNVLAVEMDTNLQQSAQQTDLIKKQKQMDKGQTPNQLCYPGCVGHLPFTYCLYM